MHILDWNNDLMGNNIVLIIGLVISLTVINWWGKHEEKWRENNNFGAGKKILKILGILLIVIFGLPGIILFFGTI
jgi:hypothetical protein